MTEVYELDAGELGYKETNKQQKWSHLIKKKSKKHVIPLGQPKLICCTLYCFMPTENGVMLIIWVSSEYLLLSHFTSPIASEVMSSSTGSSVVSSDINSFGIFTLFLWFLWLKWIMKMKAWKFSRKLIGKDDSSFLLLISIMLRMVKIYFYYTTPSLLNL